MARIHPEAPTDDAGHPVHPEQGYSVCGRQKRGGSTSKNGRDRDDVPYCLAAAGWGREEAGEPGDACKHHGAPGGPEGNTKNLKHGAYREQFTNHLTQAEQDAFDEAARLLEDPEGAQEVARIAATTALLQWQRSQDPEFLRRFESICEKFGLAPEEVLQVEHSGSVDHEHSHELDDKQRAHIDAITGGPEEIDVEPVEDA